MDRAALPSSPAGTTPEHRLRRLARWLVAWAAAGTLAGALTGCANPSKPAPAPAPAPVAEPAPPPAPLPPPPPAAPPPAVSQALQQQAFKTALLAVDQLQAGSEEQARAELQRALAVDPNSKLAQSLQRQINADPQVALGRDSFSYTVKPGETLSKIAGRFMNDIYAFYILARYNDIKIPRLVAGGQTLRIPGKAPPPGAVDKPAAAATVRPTAGSKDKEPREPAVAAASPPPAAVQAPEPIAVAVAVPASEPTPGQKALAAAQAAERGGDLDRALADYRRAGSLDQPGANAKATQVQKQLVARYTGNARRASVKQDLDGAIANWDRVLQLDGDNQTATLERQKAVELKKKLEAF